MINVFEDATLPQEGPLPFAVKVMVAEPFEISNALGAYVQLVNELAFANTPPVRLDHCIL
jgi:hypothetical protein